MHSRLLILSICTATVPALSGIAAAQAPPPTHLQGLLNDVGPSTVKGGPYEMHGTWSVHLHGDSGTADFSAAMTMETSDYAAVTGTVNPADPSTRGAHTHHIMLHDATVSFDATGCPDLSTSPATKTGFKITGPVNLLTGNGSPAPFETTPPTSQLQVCITGASPVEYSNITLVFLPGSPAIKHFGTGAIHGVVVSSRRDDD